MPILDCRGVGRGAPSGKFGGVRFGYVD